MSDRAEPTENGAADILAVLERLTPQQHSALALLMEQGGQGCGLSSQMCVSLIQRDLLVKAIDPLTDGPRVCSKGCGHAWYDIPEVVHDAYISWSSQWDEPAEPIPQAAPRPLATRPDRVQMWWCRFTLPGQGYFTYKGTNYDRGQLLTLTGGPRDEQLERLGYVYPVPKGETHRQAQCGVCGQWFLTEEFREQHGRLRHRGRFADDDGLDVAAGMEGPAGGAALRDITGDAEERRMQQQYPLHLDRTRATLESA
jgi:hypothetical protein